MQTVIKVKLWGKDVAAVIWDNEKEIAILEFFESFAKNGLDIAPIIMPKNDLMRGERLFSYPTHRNKTFKGLPGLLSDALPDDYGNAVIDEWFAIQGINVSTTPLDRLCYIGTRGMGALEFEPAISQLNESTILEIDQLTKLAGQVLNERETFATNLKNGEKTYIDNLRVGTSAGGAKPKAIIAYNEHTKEVRSGQVKAPEGFTYWLLKFDGIENAKLKDNPLGIGRIEYAYHLMAVNCGIEMTECKLLYEGEYAHFMTKRFDRTDTGEKLHIQTLCAIAHYDRDERYAYEQIFAVMRKLHLPYKAMEQMYRRMLFNVIARNQDDHTKNHSFRMDRTGKWSLAPAYDLCYAYSPTGKWTNRHQLSINGKRDDFTKTDLLEAAKNANVKNAEAILNQITTVVSKWKNYATIADVKQTHIEQIQQNLRLDIK